MNDVEKLMGKVKNKIEEKLGRMIINPSNYIELTKNDK